MGGSKPIVPIRGDAIPNALRARSQWVAWRWEWDAQKQQWTKPPYQVQRPQAHASSTNAKTWCSYEEAWAARDHFDGIGYALTDTDPFVGVDLDHCRDLETGEIAAWAQGIVDQFQSYTEVSPSGTGLRILAEGHLPGGGRKHDDCEVYATGRYLTITGAHIAGTPHSVELRQDTIDRFYAEYFPPPAAAAPAPTPGSSVASPPGRWSLDDAVVLARARTARNGALFERLWSGDAMGDHSKADLMLCGMLAFWTVRDGAQMDRLFRLSSLARTKWDERHGGDGRTYGQMTLARAIADCRTVWEPAERRTGTAEPISAAEPWRPPYTLAEFFAAPPAEPPWLVRGLFRSSTNGWLGAGAKVGKSYLALDLLIACALGRPWLDQFHVDRPLTVVLIEEEDHPFRVYERARRLIRGRALPDTDVPKTFRLDVRKGYRLDDAATLAPLIDWLGEIHADLVVWDVFNRLHLKDERKPDQIMPVLWQLDRIRDLVGCTNLLAHHQRKQGVAGPDTASGGQKLRGPSEFWGWAENSLYLSPLKGKGIILVEPESKDATLEPFKAHLEDTSEDARRWVYDGIVQGKADEIARRHRSILEVLRTRGSLNAALIRQALIGEFGAKTPTDKTIRRDLNSLLDAQAVTREGTSKDTQWGLQAAENPDDPGF